MAAPTQFLVDLAGASGTVAPGDYLTPDFTFVAYTKATSINRLAVGGIYTGIAITAGAQGGQCTMQTSGVVSNSITGLGVGAAGPAYINNLTARLTRTVDGPQIGTVDGSGNVTLTFGGGSAATIFFDVKTYGALGDGVTDDYAAFRAAIDAMSGANALGGRLYIPGPATYKLNSDLHIDRQMTIEGDGGGAGNGTVLLFAAGKGIIVDGPTTTPGPGTRGDWSTIRGIAIYSSSLTLADWQNAHVYTVGTLVRATTVDATLGTRDHRYYFECTTGGTSSGADPFGTGGHILNSTIADNTVVWTARVHANILAKAPFYGEDLYCQDATNANIAIQCAASESPPTNGNSGRLTRVQCYFGGLGISIVGSDANAWDLHGILIIGTGTHWPGTSPFVGGTNGGHGIHDHAFLGTHGTSVQVEGVLGRAMVVDGTGTSTYIGSYIEGSQGASHITTPSVFIPGQDGSLYTSTSTAMILQRNNAGCQRVFFSDDQANVASPIQAYPIPHDFSTVYGWSNNNTGSNQLIGWRFQNNTDTGWWALSNGNQNYTQAIGISQKSSAEGAGNWGDLRGHFRGTTDSSGKYFLGVAVGSEFDYKVNAGQHKIGYRYEPTKITTLERGTYGRIISVTGFRGPTWVSGQTAVVADATFGTPATMVQPTAPNGFAYRCTVSGTAGGGEPVWPLVIGNTVVDGGITWQCVGVTPTYYDYGDIFDKTTLSKSVAGGAGTTTLTAAEYAHRTVIFTGALTGNRVIEFPALDGVSWIVFNNTTGAFTLTVKHPATAGYAITQTKTSTCWSDGTTLRPAAAEA